MKRSGLVFFLIMFTSCLIFISCKKDSFITSSDARIILSDDTLHFDTVFTSTGSITKVLRIFNDNDQKLHLSKIRLMGGTSSAYRMSADGISAAEVDDLDIAANDSIYVFVAVTINPNTANQPFIVSDSILISYNGNNRFIQLQAYGQNANFLRNRVISGNVTWTNTLPYVILGSIRIDTTATLTIQQGCRIYSHADAPFIVDGTLLINGTKSDSVVFEGDRLDQGYKDLPAGWPGIYIRGNSKNNVFTHAIIKNANQGLVLGQPSINANPKLILHQCIVDNAWDAGIFCMNSSLQADNCLVSNCGSNISLTYGGNYTFTHCTVAAYSNPFINHKNPVLTLTDYTFQNGNTVTASLNAVFRNNIFWGDNGFVNDEIAVIKQGTNTFSILFDRNIFRAGSDPGNSILTNNIKNQDPAFDSIDIFRQIYNFRISKNPAAPGINKGSITTFTKDLDDNNRNVGIPDLGCYEKQ